MVTAADLAREFGFTLVVIGGEEAWTVASLLGRAGGAVVLSSRSRQDEDVRLERESGWSIEGALRLHEAGVPVALVHVNRAISLGGVGGGDLNTLNLEAAFAVRGGLPEAAAVEAITIAPARLLGVDDRVGSIEVGKDADLILLDGDLLHYESFVYYAVVNGRLANDPTRSDEEDQRLVALRKELAVAGVEFDWEPVAREVAE